MTAAREPPLQNPLGCGYQAAGLLTKYLLFKPHLGHNLAPMAATSLIQSRLMRCAFAVFFILSGVFFTLGLILVTPSFWYIPCAILWTLSGLVWLIRPAWAPGFAVFPVLGIAVLILATLSPIPRGDSYFFLFVVCFVIGLVIVAISFREKESRRLLPLAVSFGLVLTSFTVDRLFTNKLAIHTYSMSWTADGKTPWSDDSERNAKGEPPVIVYRRLNHGYCYDAIFSSELKSRLTASKKDSIIVEYNSFNDFGHERRYNVRSVDGLVFNDGKGAVRPDDGYGGTTLDDRGSVDCPR